MCPYFFFGLETHEFSNLLVVDSTQKWLATVFLQSEPDFCALCSCVTVSRQDIKIHTRPNNVHRLSSKLISHYNVLLATLFFFITFKLCFMNSISVPCYCAFFPAQWAALPCGAYRQAMKLGELKESWGTCIFLKTDTVLP